MSLRSLTGLRRRLYLALRSISEHMKIGWNLSIPGHWIYHLYQIFYFIDLLSPKRLNIV
jgi:hypothetical protein